MLKLGFIGAGTVGTALAVRLSQKGYPVVAAFSRRQTSAENLARAAGNCQVLDNAQGVSDTADLVFITTPDGAIPQVASQLQWHPEQSVVHCSGADSTDVLETARKMGTKAGVFHPLQTFASVEQAIDNIPGSTFALEAEEPLLDILKEMATALDGHRAVGHVSHSLALHGEQVGMGDESVSVFRHMTRMSFQLMLRRSHKTPCSRRSSLE